MMGGGGGDLGSRGQCHKMLRAETIGLQARHAPQQIEPY